MGNVRIWKYGTENGIEDINEVLLNRPLFSLDDATLLIPSGGYTTFRTYEHDKVLRLQDHFSRLRETAEISGRKADTIYDNKIRDAIRYVIQDYPGEELRIRIVIDFESFSNSIYLLVDRLTIPSEQAYAEGVDVITKEYNRSNPKAKLTNFIKPANEIRFSSATNVNEILMKDNTGRILEGLSSNFYGVLGAQLWTANENVLPGITRSYVLDLAVNNQIPICLNPINQNQIQDLKEAFITSTSRSILPIHSIDKIIIGNGSPGSLTQKLSQLFAKQLSTELEII